MALSSPGVSITEVSALRINADASLTSTGALGSFNKGPFNKVVNITSLFEFNNIFGYGTTALYQGLERLLNNNIPLSLVRVEPGVKGGTPTEVPVQATLPLDDTADTPAVIVTALEYGSYANDIGIQVQWDDSADATVTVYYRDVLVETFSNVDVTTLSTSDNSIEKITSSYVVFTKNNDTVGTVAAGEIVKLTGGVSGIPLSEDFYGMSADVPAIPVGIDLFKDTEQVDIDLFIVPGQTDIDIQKNAVALAEERKDCLYILDMESDLTPSEALDFINAEGSYTSRDRIESEFATTYFPWVNIESNAVVGPLLTPPSLVMAEVIAKSEKSADIWSAPAGYLRGVVADATSLAYQLSKSDRDSFQTIGQAINPIIELPNIGTVVYGQKTLDRDRTVQKSINVRRLTNYIRTSVTSFSNSILFESNDKHTWLRWENIVSPFLREIQAKRGISSFTVKMDETTMTEEEISNNIAKGYITIVPVTSVEKIYIDFMIENAVI